MQKIFRGTKLWEIAACFIYIYWKHLENALSLFIAENKKGQLVGGWSLNERDQVRNSDDWAANPKNNDHQRSGGSCISYPPYFLHKISWQWNFYGTSDPVPILLRTPTTNVAACITLANTAGFVAFYRASHATRRLMLVSKEFGNCLEKFLNFFQK